MSGDGEPPARPARPWSMDTSGQRERRVDANQLGHARGLPEHGPEAARAVQGACHGSWPLYYGFLFYGLRRGHW